MTELDSLKEEVLHLRGRMNLNHEDEWRRWPGAFWDKMEEVTYLCLDLLHSGIHGNRHVINFEKFLMLRLPSKDICNRKRIFTRLLFVKSVAAIVGFNLRLFYKLFIKSIFIHASFLSSTLYVRYEKIFDTFLEVGEYWNICRGFSCSSQM